MCYNTPVVDAVGVKRLKDDSKPKGEKVERWISAERSDALAGPNWINVIINMLCLYV